MNEDDFTTFYIPPATSNTVCPFGWGDLVHIKDTPSSCYEFIYMPDNGNCEAETYIVSRGKNKFGFWQTAQREWEQLEKIPVSNCNYYDQLEETFRANRQCFCINSWKWTYGLTFHIPWGHYSKLAEQYILFPETKFNDDDNEYLRLTKRFWHSDFLFWRVIFHVNDSDDGWELLGPFEHRQQAEDAYNSVLGHALKERPQMIRHGIYKNSGQINGIFLYQGPYVKKKNCFLIGQGEILSSTDGINLRTILL